MFYRQYINNILISLKEIFRNPAYCVFAFIIAACVVMCMVFVQNIPFIQTVWSSHTYSLQNKAHITAESLYAFNTNLTHLSQFFHITIALLMAIDISLLVYYYRSRRKVEGAAGISLVGMISGILGIGCSVCGSVVLSSLIGLSAATVLITILPFHGIEFSITGIVILLLSIAYLGNKMQAPVVCKK